MRTAIFTVLALMLSACASIPFIDGRLAPYTNSEQAKNASIIFGDLRGSKSVLLGAHVVAECHDLTFDTLIIVDIASWNTLSELQRHWVIQHELGHCIKGLDHDERLDARGCPVSVMYPLVPKDECIKQTILGPYRDDTKLNSK